MTSFKKDGDHIIGCYHNTRGLWAIAYNPRKNALYVPFQDQCLSMTANTKTPAGWGPRAGIIRPGSDPQKYMNLARIDVATGELRVRIGATYPLSAAAEAHRALEGRATTGKVLLLP